MCRHLAHLGPLTSLAALLADPPHGLVHQAYAPRDMRGSGTINADGFGAGWYPSPGADPVRYRSADPIWSDTSFAALAAATTATAVLAAVRSATTGMPVVATASAPFTAGRWLFSHNGVVAGWPGSVAAMAGSLPVTDLLTLDAPTDAALLWALVRRGLVAGDDPARVLTEVVTQVAAAAPGSRLNLLLTDGTTVWATTWGHALSVRGGTQDIDPDLGTGAAAVTVASEPDDDDPAWTPVPDRQLLVARPDHRYLRALASAPAGDPADAPLTAPATSPAIAPAAIRAAEPGAAAPAVVRGTSASTR